MHKSNARKARTPRAYAPPLRDQLRCAEDLSKVFSEAMADAQAKSLAAMNEKMHALYASVELGGGPQM